MTSVPIVSNNDRGGVLSKDDELEINDLCVRLYAARRMLVPDSASTKLRDLDIEDTITEVPNGGLWGIIEWPIHDKRVREALLNLTCNELGAFCISGYKDILQDPRVFLHSIQTVMTELAVTDRITRLEVQNASRFMHICDKSVPDFLLEDVIERMRLGADRRAFGKIVVLAFVESYLNDLTASGFRIRKASELEAFRTKVEDAFWGNLWVQESSQWPTLLNALRLTLGTFNTIEIITAATKLKEKPTTDAWVDLIEYAEANPDIPLDWLVGMLGGETA